MLKMELTKNVFFFNFFVWFLRLWGGHGHYKGSNVFIWGPCTLTLQYIHIYFSLSLSLYIYWLKFSKADEGNPHICEAQREPPFTHNASPHHTIMTA